MLVVLALGIALLIKAFVVQAFFIQMESMEPTLHPSERVLVSKFGYRFDEPERGDIVIIRDPRDPCRDPDMPCDRSIPVRVGDWLKELFGLPLSARKDLVKRIVGLPGETISMKDGETYIDGREVELPSTDAEGPQLDDQDLDPVKIPDDAYYLLGDNRAGSADSRSFGPVATDAIVGRAFVVVWPPGGFRGL